MSNWGNQPTQFEQPGPAQKMSTGKKVGVGCLGAVGVLVALAVLGAIVGEDETTTASKQAAAPSLSAAPATPTTQSATPATTPPSASPKAAKTTEAARVTLPNFVGMGLQSAQDTAQAAGFYALTSHDALGRDRLQALDRNWQVCSQNYAPGKTIPTDTTLDFGAVKLDEQCPSKDKPAPSAAGATMPDFGGDSVKAARAALDSSTSITVEDASGQDRMVLMESNWQVCTQNPSPGKALTGQPVEFTAVKFGETCP